MTNRQPGVATGSALLDYSLQSDPDPLTVGTSATLTIVVSNGSNRLVTLDALAFAFPSGANAKDLTDDPAGLTVQTPDGWTASRVGGTVTLTPPPDDTRIGPAGLTFQFSLTVNSEVGTAEIGITETTQGQSGPVTNRGSLAVAKFPAGFSVGELTAEPLILEPGGSTTLSWQGADLPGTSYTLEYGTVTKLGLPATDSMPVEGLEATTVFYLVVTATVGQEQVTIERERTVTVNRVEILAFEGPDTTALPNQEVSLSWTTHNADSCILKAGGDVIDAKAPTNANGYEVTLDGNSTIYTLIATGRAAKGSVEKQLTVPAIHYEAAVFLDNLPGAPIAVVLPPPGDTLYIQCEGASDIQYVSVLDKDKKVDSIPASAFSHIMSFKYKDVHCNRLIFGKDGKNLYVGREGFEGISSIDTLTRKATKIYVKNKEDIFSFGGQMVANIDRSKIYIYSETGILTSIDTSQEYKVRQSVSSGIWGVSGLAMYRSNDYILVISETYLFKINPANSTTIKMVSMQERFNGRATFSADGSSIYVSTYDNDLLVVDATSFKVTKRVPAGGETRDVVLVPGLPAALVALRGTNQVGLLNTETNEIVQKVAVGDKPTCIAVSADGKTAYVGNRGDNTISILTY